ncbi:MAG: winged helix-turn-helix transcriptional regulator [Rhizobiales bacterium]|nr:winged helix-turn-helix transcriptional regulator [Hyphomicrobiales bacterium]
MATDYKLPIGRADADDVADSETERGHIASLLASVEREAHVSQRRLASELGVALGLVNTYIKRCVKKGLIKVQQAPSRRYAYYLTPQGFAEKSRLTAEYLAWSLTFFRRARGECAELMAEARRRGWRNVGLVGGSDLAEIAILSAAEQGVTIAAVVDAGMQRQHLLSVAVAKQVADVAPAPDGWVVTAIGDAQATYDALAAGVGPAGVLVPAMLSITITAGEAGR